jgi:hypothetical protein
MKWAERWAAPEPAHIPSGASPGRDRSSGPISPDEGTGHSAGRGLQDRATYPLHEGLQ